MLAPLVEQLIATLTPPLTLDVVIDGVAVFDTLTVLEAASLLRYPLATAIALTVEEAAVRVNAPVYCALDVVGAEPLVV